MTHHHRPEAVDPCAVLDGVCFPVVPDVAVLPHPLVVTHALLPVDHAVLLGECRPKLARSSVEPIIFILYS